MKRPLIRIFLKKDNKEKSSDTIQPEEVHDFKKYDNELKRLNEEKILLQKRLTELRGGQL